MNEIYWEKTKLSVIDKVHSQILKLRKINQLNQIRRGVKENDEKDSEKSQEAAPVSHLVFVIHGIAQRY